MSEKEGGGDMAIRSKKGSAREGGFPSLEQSSVRTESGMSQPRAMRSTVFGVHRITR